MKHLLTVAILWLGCSVSFAQQSKNMNLLGKLTYSQNLSDIWGYADGGKEYALVGVRNGVSIVDITDPANPNELYFASGASSTWRDLKTWNKHAYITNETGDGLTIIDLSNLPSVSPAPKVIKDTTHFKKAHNLYIDENGFCYVFGSNKGGGGALILDLNNDPEAPTYAGNFGTYYLHDGMVRGDTLWGSAIYGGYFSVIDVSDKANPVELATQQTPGAFAHNAWISDNNRYLFTTDEISNAFIGAFDVSDLSNIKMVDKVQSNPGSNTTVHNTHFINNYIVTSYYHDGTTIHDVSRPNNTIEVGHYDSAPQSGGGYNGAWGAYPWLPSGNIIESNVSEGLFIYGPNYVRGCYLEGSVKDTITKAPIPSADVDIVSSGIVKVTGITGTYATGTADSGTYDVTFSHPAYFSKTVKGVHLVNGVVTNLHVELVPKRYFTFSGQVTELSSGNPIPGADVKIANQDFVFDTVTDASGNFTVNNLVYGTYNIIAGKWGYVNECVNQFCDSTNNNVSLALPDGIYDDFTFDNNWTVSGNATTGIWEIGEPQGTTNGNDEANPDLDVQNDCYNQAYITGNGGGSAGSDDVDNGSTHLRSPVIDGLSINDPFLLYHYWFYNGSGSGTPNDSMIVSVYNGTDTKVLDIITVDSTMSAWVPRGFRLSDAITLTSTMQFIFTVSDSAGGGGHIVEGALDLFRVIDSVDVGTYVPSAVKANLRIFPNPSHGSFNLIYQSNHYTSGDMITLRIADMTGRVIEERSYNTLNIQNDIRLSPGVYMISVLEGERAMAHERLIVTE
ncbi:MAG: choice-of-anchor B family protein [Flavobacteriales bacterium]|nr:choice-of-anchor B family protein [Flavobacteriales bacterium]